MPKIPRSVLVVIYTTDLDVLLIERADHPGFWQSVTGSVDTPDELLQNTAIREVAEELGMQIGSDMIPLANLQDWQLSNEYDIYEGWRHRYGDGVTRNTEFVYGLEVPRATPVTLSPAEHINYRWLPYDEAAQYCFSPSNRAALLQLPARTGR